MRVHFSATPGRAHNLYLELTEAPPEGVEYVFPAVGETGFAPPRNAKPSLVDRVRASPAFRHAYKPILRDVLGGVGVVERARSLRRKRPWDLYHAVGGVHPYPEPWVVGCESVLDFFGMAADPHAEIEDRGQRRYVLRKLLSRHCRRILPWTDAARRSILATFPEARDALDAKIEVMPLAIRAGARPPARTPSDRLRILFVGSKNFPHDFLPKGGNHVLEAFARLRERIPASLVVRAKAPEAYATRYHATKDVRIVDSLLSDTELRALYDEADVFLYPAVYTPGMVVLEAMRAGLPPVVLDVWGNGEIVADGVTGRVLPPQDGVPYLTRTLAPNWSHDPTFTRHLGSRTEGVVASIVDALEALHVEPAARLRMGEAARREVEPGGRFSIERRNAALARVYREAVGA